MKVAEGLTESDPVVLNAARTFFAMTIDAHLYFALMSAARIHDSQSNAVTIRTLLQRASQESPKYGNEHELKAAIVDAEKILAGLSRTAKAIAYLEKSPLSSQSKHNDRPKLRNTGNQARSR